MVLIASILKLISDISRNNNIKLVFKNYSYSEEQSDAGFKLVIYRIIQEQLNNILKHAKAMQVAIYLSQNEKSIILSISDSGVGFDPGQKRKGTGIDNIKSWAASYNGTADFVSQRGAGCSLIVSFPVESL
jgi:two-component system, NarL family, sensor histidine kinase UhpB